MKCRASFLHGGHLGLDLKNIAVQTAEERTLFKCEDKRSPLITLNNLGAIEGNTNITEIEFLVIKWHLVQVNFDLDKENKCDIKSIIIKITISV